MGKLEVRNDVKRPYYFVRVNVPVIDALTGERKQMREKRALGFRDEISKKRAMELRAELLDVVNQGRTLVQSQIRFKDLVRRFVEIRLPKFGIATQSQYRSQIDNHLLVAFGEQKLSDINKASIEQFMTTKEESVAGGHATTCEASFLQSSQPPKNGGFGKARTLHTACASARKNSSARNAF
jgi:hypothetical protein